MINMEYEINKGDLICSDEIDQISPLQIREPKCNLRPFHYYEIIIAILVFFAPFIFLYILPRIYDISFGDYLALHHLILAVLDIALVHCIYKKTFCTDISNPAFCFFTVPLVEYIEIILILLISFTFLSGFIGFSLEFLDKLLRSLAEFFGVGFFEEIMFRFTFFNIFMDLLRFQKHKVLISLIVTSICFGLTHYMNAVGNSKEVGPRTIQVIHAGIDGFSLNMIYYMTGNIWICIIIHGLYDFSLSFPLQVFKKADNMIFLALVLIIAILHMGFSITYSILLYKNKIKWFKKKNQIGNGNEDFFLVTTNKNQYV